MKQSLIAHPFGIWALAVGLGVFMDPAPLAAQDEYATAAELKLMEDLPRRESKSRHHQAILYAPFKDAYLDGYNLNAFYAIVSYLSKT